MKDALEIHRSMMKNGICHVLDYPDYLPSLLTRIERHAKEAHFSPSRSDIQIRAKWIMLDKGIAATGHLIHKRENSSSGEYRLPIIEDYIEAIIQAAGELGFPYPPFTWQEVV